MATIIMVQGPPTNGTSGSYTGAAFGDELIDIANLLKYVNTSLIAGSPTWSLVSLTSGTQTIAGDKTFSGNSTFSGTLTALSTITLNSNTTVGAGTFILAGSVNFRRTPSTTQALTLVTDTLSGFQNVVFTTGSNLTLTSAPTIADGANGNCIRLTNIGSFNLVLTDQGTLPSSNLRLTNTTVTIAPRQSLELQFLTAIGDWVQVSPLCAVI